MASQPVKRERPAYPWGPPRRSRRRWRRWILFSLLAGVLLILLAPMIVAHSPILDIILSSVLEPDQGRLTAAGASLGWFSSLALDKVKILDSEGQKLLDVSTIRIDRSLVGLLMDRVNLGTIRVEQPTFFFVGREEGSNVEDFIEPWLEPQDSKPIRVRIEIVDGIIEATDQPTQTTWRAESIGLTCSIAKPTPETATVSLQAKLTLPSREDDPGDLEISYNRQPNGKAAIDIRTDTVSIAPMAGLIRRLGVPNSHLAGWLTFQAAASWSTNDASPIELDTTGQATLWDCDISVPALGDDRIQLQEVEMPWKIRLDGDRIHIQKMDIHSEIGTVSVEGSVAWADWFSVPFGETQISSWLAAIRQPLCVHGQVDLARIAAMVPASLRIRHGTTITSGKARFDLQSMTAGTGHRWSGELVTSDLAARDSESTWNWEQPIHLVFAIRNEGGWEIEAARCDSDFVQIAMTGDSGRFTTQATCDLSQLVTHLGQFVDLSDWELGGRGEVTMESQSDAEKYQLDSKATVDSLRVVHGTTVLLNEPRLEMTAKAAGRMVENRPRSCDAASVEIISAQDVVRANLVEPVEFPVHGFGSLMQSTSDPGPVAGKPDQKTTPLDKGSDPGAPWIIHLTATGPLPGWQARLKPWLPLAGWKIDGQTRLSADLGIGSNEVHVEQATWTIMELHATGSKWRIDDPKVEWQLNHVQYKPSDRQITLGDSTWTSSVLAARTRNVSATWLPEQPLRVSGEIAIRALLERLDSWRIPADGLPHQWRYAGEMIGKLQVATQAGKTSVDLNTWIERLALYSYVPASSQGPAGYRPAWQEPKVQLTAKVIHDGPKDQVQIEAAELVSDTLASSATGSIGQLTTMPTVQIRGTVEYDLARWTPFVTTYLGPDVQLIGRDRATFEVTGKVPQSMPNDVAAAPGTLVQTRQAEGSPTVPSSHWSRTWSGSAAAGWQGVDLYGLPVGPGRIQAHLADGAVQVEPLQVAVGGEGDLSFALQMRLDPQPQELLFPPGQVLRNIHVTPEVSDRLLKYIAPVLDNATDSEGTFSLSLAGGRIPFGAV
ncbi:MAG: hypothetical protein JW829_07175, partial [Pirellulales bacterium]|nr:hypothetical protein [Pirellulales bacterium]